MKSKCGERFIFDELNICASKNVLTVEISQCRACMCVTLSVY